MRSRARLLAVLATMLQTLALGCAEATRSDAAYDGYILTRSIAPNVNFDMPIDVQIALLEAGAFDEVIITENRPYREGEPVTIVERVLGIEHKATGRNLRDAECELERMRIDESLRRYDDYVTYGPAFDSLREATLQARDELEAACDPYR